MTPPTPPNCTISPSHHPSTYSINQLIKVFVLLKHPKLISNCYLPHLQAGTHAHEESYDTKQGPPTTPSSLSLTNPHQVRGISPPVAVRGSRNGQLDDNNVVNAARQVQSSYQEGKENGLIFWGALQGSACTVRANSKGSITDRH